MFDTSMIIHIYIDLRPIYICIIIDESRLFIPFAPNVAPSAPEGAHVIYSLPATCPPLPRAAYGGLYQGRSAGYFIPRPPAVSRLERVARARVASSPRPCRSLQLATPQPIRPQRGLPNMIYHLPAGCPPSASLLYIYLHK